MNLVRRLIEEVSDRHPIKILVVGDAMVDHWVHGHVEGCQDGCHKFIEESRVSVPGGAANAQRCISLWENVRTTLSSYPEAECPHKWRFVNESGRIVFRRDVERRTTPFEVVKRLQECTLGMVAHSDAVLLSDYDKGFLTTGFIRQVIDRCNSRGIPCVADAKRGPELYGGATVKANIDWYLRYGECDVVTHGERLPVVRGVAPANLHMDVNGLPPVKCVNHVGAGDCFAAYLTLALAYGFSLKDAAAVAHSAGRVYVQFAHNRPPIPEEIAADMEASLIRA